MFALKMGLAGFFRMLTVVRLCDVITRKLISEPVSLFITGERMNLVLENG
jgi:hypothetical protein